MIKIILKPYFARILLLLLLWIVLGAILLSYSDKGDYVLWAAKHRSLFFNRFFYFFTQLGNGWVLSIVLLILAFIKFEYFLKLSIILGITALLIILFKQIVFTGFSRPIVFFQNRGIVLNPVPYTSLNHLYSFPSGHTAAGFAFFISLACFIKQKNYVPLFFICATLVGFSRVYLGQHFFMDVYAGAIIGSLTSIVVMWFFEKKQWNINYSLIELFRKA